MYVFLYLSVLYAGLPGRPADWLMGHFLLKIKIYLSIYLSIYLDLLGLLKNVVNKVRFNQQAKCKTICPANVSIGWQPC